MEINLKPSTNKEVQEISKECFEWWKRYNNYSNASADKKLHFSEVLWTEILGHKDEAGEFHYGTFDQIYNKYPCEFTSNMLMAFLNELRARDTGAYKEVGEIGV